MGTTVAAIVALLVCSGDNRVSTKDAFTMFENNSGWTNGTFSYDRGGKNVTHYLQVDGRSCWRSRHLCGRSRVVSRRLFDLRLFLNSIRRFCRTYLRRGSWCAAQRAYSYPCWSGWYPNSRLAAVDRSIFRYDLRFLHSHHYSASANGTALFGRSWKAWHVDDLELHHRCPSKPPVA